ncbi:hypothetical protein MYCTH_2295255 [Thermothelomyces thermophilus ATCC 42464]|uniref:DUF3752 domain-containing protein n=1 Tax=Thermothelomyces thermophilus (strain ATCC 42464 / BCRC 31852 / DSM 1799) TaxID=573729 RepID=G2Q441_THET4|nr:uncharacterized protein MYCTH_2295255 [Thermothelomyces thermophilus ATCC 42464]AEO53640.1 hypothetical protein MYCTH_2295255 [Thermothelomyces thermophilus ATCC 42464]
MASIGPQLPPHLQKRKRTPEDEEAESGCSPPPKASRRENDDEIPLDDDDLDDAFGPSAPGSTRNGDTEETASRPKPVIGPSLPPSVANNSTPAPRDEKRSVGPSLPPTKQPSNSDEIPLDSDPDQDTPGPAPPPPPPPKRVLGPAPPPADLSERPTTDPDDSDSSEDDDDDWGPALPGESSTRSRAAAAAAAAAAATATSSLSEPEPGSTAPKRDDWMLAPPTSSGPRAPDPTKLRPRKFATGPRAATAADGRPPAGVSAIWTETPEEKARRLANAVLGREDPNAAPSAAASRGPEVGSGGSGSRRADAARVKSYVEQTRGKSLVEQHQEARAAGKAAASSAARLKGDGAKWGVKAGGSGDDDEEEDDPSKRAFDWEKDMKVLGRITNAQRRELLNRAANFGNRFQSGKFL